MQELLQANGDGNKGAYQGACDFDPQILVADFGMAMAAFTAQEKPREQGEEVACGERYVARRAMRAWRDDGQTARHTIGQHGAEAAQRCADNGADDGAKDDGVEGWGEVKHGLVF